MPEAIVFQGEREFRTVFAFKVQRIGFSVCQLRMNQNKLLLIVLSSLCLLSSCIESSYFHSPIQGNNIAYHAIPVASDSIKSATYASTAIAVGGMNNRLRDNVFTFQAGLHRAHVINHVRLNYGASLALGSYDIDQSSFYSYYPGGTAGQRTGGTFFGGYNLFGGVSFATRTGRKSEWRFIGVEGGLFNEFGTYYNFRKNLPDSQATEIDKKKYLGSIGLNTEFVFKGRSGNNWGIKIAAGSYLKRLHYYDQYQGAYHHSYDDLIYFSDTFQFTFRKNTIYYQINIATHAVHFQVGYNFRL